MGRRRGRENGRVKRKKRRYKEKGKKGRREGRKEWGKKKGRGEREIKTVKKYWRLEILTIGSNSNKRQRLGKDYKIKIATNNPTGY